MDADRTPQDELDERSDALDEVTETVPAPAAAGTTVVTDDDAIDPDNGGRADDAMPAVVGDARPDDFPVRAALPDQPVADALGVGAGAPKTAVPEGIDGATGRPSENPATAYADPEENAERQRQSDAELDGGVPTPADDNPPEAFADADENARRQADSDAERKLVDENELDELKAQAEDRGLPVSGTKAELAGRIVEHDRGAE